MMGGVFSVGIKKDIYIEKLQITPPLIPEERMNHPGQLPGVTHSL
jgi:hypothetical protein